MSVFYVPSKSNILLIVLIELSPTQHVGQFLHEINLFYGQLRPMKIVLTFGSKRLQRGLLQCYFSAETFAFSQAILCGSINKVILPPL